MNKDIINDENDVKKVSKTNKQKLGQFFMNIQIWLNHFR